MSNTNLFEIQKTRKLPSPEFLHRKKQTDINRLVREILIKECQFRNCTLFNEDIQKRIYEKELGELYFQLMKPVREKSNFPETVNFPKSVNP